MKRSTTNHFKQYVARAVILVAILAVAIVPLTQVKAETLSDKIANLQTQIDAAQAEADRLRGEADSLQNALNVLSAEKNAIQIQIDLAQAKYDQLTAKIDENQKKIEKQQKVLSSTISDLSVESSTSPIELLAGSASIGDFIDRQEYRTSVQEQIENAIAIVKKLKIELAEQRKEVEVVLAEQKTQRDQLAAKEAQQAELVAKTRGEEANYKAMVGNLEKQQDEIEAQLAASVAQGSYKNVASSGYVSAGTPIGLVGNTGYSFGSHLHLEARTPSGARVNPAPFIEHTPVDMPPAWISQAFGADSDLYGGRPHSGTDYAASTNSTIYAVRGGILRKACSTEMFGFYDYGYVAVITHSDGSTMIYGHMNGPC